MSTIFVVFGPSGVGKSSVVAAALANDTCARARQVVTCTTRAPRPGEEDGKHYYFVSVPVFEGFIKDGALIEWSNVYGTYYGLLRRSVEEVVAQGFSPIVLLDRLGVMAIKKAFPGVCAIFLKPPSLAILRDRLVQRGANTSQEIENRMHLAEAEILAEQMHPLADIVIENDDFKETVKHISSFICF